ncbi:type VI secretion system lipoprotein TssJ [Pseudoduganella sp. OTU4001]|uniref:type VI secretion system lipoprotein TssJ n=1 Tax=Pseudoduganella sp. OTU4001 TaxID=3043854 RepID=UPI00313C1094
MARPFLLPKILPCVALAAMLCSCAAPPKKPSVAQANITVAADVNPDARGRPSPVVIRLYELKALGGFQNGDFFSLFERGKEVLGADVLASEEMVLRPGDKKRMDRQLQPDTRFVAAVAAFRDLDRAVWRASVAIAPNQTVPITINLKTREISITDK